MSQFFISSSAGPAPPSVATSFVTNDGTAIPAANVLNVLGGPGIITYADPNNSNNLFVSFENGCEDTGITVDAATTIITCLDLGAVAGTYTFTTTVAAYATSNIGPADNLSAGYVISGVIRATGVAGVLIGTPDKLVFEEGALTAGNCQCGVQGNNLIIACFGTAGYNIDWREVTSAVFHN